MSNHRKVVLVTGGSGGIGEGICRKLAASWDVIVHFNSNEKAAERIKQDLIAAGAKAMTAQANLSDERAVQSLFSAAIEEFGKIHAVVANAGSSGFEPIEKSELDEFQKLIDTNLIGSYLTIREAASHVTEGGKIVFVSSQLADRPRATTGMYSACKAAIDAMVVSMSHELGPRGICINSVRPGATEPGMFADSSEERKEHFRSLSPFNRLGKPQDIAGVVEGQHLRVSDQRGSQLDDGTASSRGWRCLELTAGMIGHSVGRSRIKDRLGKHETHKTLLSFLLRFKLIKHPA